MAADGPRGVHVGGSPRRVVVPSDLTWVRVNGGRSFAHVVNWDDDSAPSVGQKVIAADGGSERLDATIAEVRANGTLVLEFPDFLTTDQP